MTIIPNTGSSPISIGSIILDRSSVKADHHTAEVTKKQRIASTAFGVLKKNENSPEKANCSPEKLNRKYRSLESDSHPYLTQYTQYKNASDDEEKMRILGSFSKDVQLYIVVQIPSAIQYTPPFVRENVAFVLAAVKQNGLILEYLSDFFKGDPEVVSAAFHQNPRSLRYALCDATILYQNGGALEYASDRIRDDSSSVLQAIDQNRTAFFYASERLRQNQEILAAVSEPSIRSIQDIPENMREDKETLLKLLRENGLEFEHISEKHKRDLDIVLTALKQNYQVFEYLSDDLQNNSSVIKIAIWQDYRLLKYLNKENAKPFIVRNGLLIQHVADSLKNDKSFAIFAIQQNKEAFQYLDSSLQNDPEIIAIYQQPEIDFPNASIEIRSNKIAALAAVKRNGLFIKYVDSKIRDNSTIFMAAFEQNPLAFQYLQRACMLKMLKDDGTRLKYAGALRGDGELVEAAVRQDGLALEFAVAPARNHEYILLRAMLQNPLAFHFFPDYLRSNQKFVLQCLKRDPSIIEFVPDEMWRDRQFILSAVNENGMVLQHLQDDVWIEDDEIVHEAILQNQWAIEFAPDGIRRDQKYRESIEKKHFVKYDKQIVFNLACKTTAIALSLKIGAVAGQVPTKVVPLLTQNPLVHMDFSEGLSYKSRIYLIGHCKPGKGFFSSDNGLTIDVETVTEVIRNFFVHTEKKKDQKVRVSLVGCYSGIGRGNKTSFAEKLSVSLDKASIPAEVIGRRGELFRASLADIDQYKKIVDGFHKEPGMTVMFRTKNGKTRMRHRHLDGLFIEKDVIGFPNFGILFKNLSYYEIDLLVDGQEKILEAVKNVFQEHLHGNKDVVGVGQWFFGKHPRNKQQKTIWFINSLGNIDYARGGSFAYLEDDRYGVGDFDVYSLAHYLKKNQLKPENAIVQSKKLHSKKL